MDIEIKEVQEIIKNLESSGELSIKEEKYLNVAKLCVHLAAENVALKACVLESLEEMESHHDTNGLYSYDADGGQMDALIRLCDAQGTISDLLSMLETTSTDRIVAGIKADGVEEWVSSRDCRWNGTTEEALKYAAQLLKGASE